MDFSIVESLIGPLQNNACCSENTEYLRVEFNKGPDVLFF